MSAIDDVGAINDKLSNWIIHTSAAPGDLAGQAQMKQAIALHNQLDQLLTRAQLLDLQNAGKALTALLAKQGPTISALKQKIEATTNGIETAEQIISIAAQGIAFAAQVVALA